MHESRLTLALRTAWRAVPDPLAIPPAEIGQLAPLLLIGGAAPLVYRRIRTTPQLSTFDSSAFHEAQRYQALLNAVCEGELRTAFATLSSAGVEPILVKGWSVSRFYPEEGLRRLGDIDLLVRPEHLAVAERLSAERPEILLDLKTWDTLQPCFPAPQNLFDRSILVPLLETPIRVLCPEDSLRYVAIHMLRHGAWSPGWLVDVAVLLESRPPEFNWNICLGDDPTRAAWVLAALVLAHELLGADIAGTPAEHHKIPGWLAAAVLERWENPNPADNQPPESLWSALAHPWRLPHGLRKRWPDPIAAAIETGRALDEHSRLRSQLRYCANLVARFVTRPFR